MCFVCLAVALASVVAVFPNAGDFDERKLTELAVILKPYLPAETGAAERLADRLATFARDEFANRPRPGWRAYVPVLRPREAALKARARRAAADVFAALRDGVVKHADDAHARARDAELVLDELARFYAALGGYKGDPANRYLLRAFSLGGLPFLSFSLIASGATIAQFPQLCGAAPALLGGHLDHVLIGAGVGIGAALSASALTQTGSAWLNSLGTAPADRAAGAARAERLFWSELNRRWRADAALPRLPGAGGPAAPVHVFSKPLREACARWLSAS